MEYELEKTAVGVIKKSLDAVAEQPVDIDFTLPDYCPDIEKILRCKLVPKIYNRNLSGGQLRVDGTAVVNILYTDSKNNVRACEQSLPFNSSFSLKDIPDNPVIETNTKCEYLNCRPLSRRRITVHGAFTLYAKVKSKAESELYSPDDNIDLEYNTEEITVSSVSALCQEQFSAGDEIQVINKPPVEVVLDSGVRANITDYKVMNGRIMFNGELNVRLLYLSSLDKSAVSQIDYSIPFSKTVECSGLEENTNASVTLSVLSYDVRLKSDILSENPVVSIDSRLSATVTAFKNENITIVLDAYSTDYFVELERSSVSVNENTEIIENTFMYKDSVSVEDCDINEIIDFNVNYALSNYTIDDGVITVNSKLNVCILAQDSSNEPEYIERALEFENKIEAPGFNSIADVNAEIISVSYRIADNNKVEIRCEIKYTVVAENISRYNIVSSVSVDEDKKLQKNSAALTLYFPEKDEKIWDIAKRYNTRKSLITEENSLESDTADACEMLLIPMV